MSAVVPSASPLAADLRSVLFSRSSAVRGGWVLLGVPPERFEQFCCRLFVLRCQLVSSGCHLSSRRLWVSFSCPRGLSGRLALLFPAPPGVPPLFVSASGAVLSGAAERSLRGLSASALESRGVRVQCACQGGSSQLSLAG